MNILRHSEYKNIILVDGYNLLFADEGLRELSKTDLKEARNELERLLSGYSIYIKEKILLIYDGHFVKDNRGELLEKDGLIIVFTKENETADSRIEALTFELSERFKITVVTSDFAEQNLVFMKEIERMGSREFFAKMKDSFRLEKKMHSRKVRLADSKDKSDWKEILKHWKENHRQDF